MHADNGLSDHRIWQQHMSPLIWHQIWRYCKMFFTESAARGLMDVIDVIDVIDHHAWRPIDTPAYADDAAMRGIAR
jgi:hypothetical protein